MIEFDWITFKRVVEGISATVHGLKNRRITNHGYLNFTLPNHEDKKTTCCLILSFTQKSLENFKSLNHAKEALKSRISGFN